jgi:alkylated DNA nucleotide flippase Atl1
MLGGEGLSQQVALLRAEGVEVTEEGLIDLEAYAWDGVGR